MKNRKVYVTTFCSVAVAMNIVLGIITSAIGDIQQCHLARCSRKCSICNCFFSKVPKKLFMRQSSKKRVYEINGLKE